LIRAVMLFCSTISNIAFPPPIRFVKVIVG
jgi:hypothetical protein